MSEELKNIKTQLLFLRGYLRMKIQIVELSIRGQWQTPLETVEKALAEFSTLNPSADGSTMQVWLGGAPDNVTSLHLIKKDGVFTAYIDGADVAELKSEVKSLITENLACQDRIVALNKRLSDAQLIIKSYRKPNDN